MTRIPPSAALLIGLFVGMGTGITSMYFYLTERLDAELATAEKNTVIEGTKQAAIIKQETDKNTQLSNELKQQVKTGETKIVINDRFTLGFTNRLQSKISRAQSFAD